MAAPPVGQKAGRKDKTVKMTGKVLKKYTGGDELRVYRDGYTIAFISIDRTFYGPEWCEKHDMSVSYQVEADNGEKFDIWEKENELICAIPVKGV